MGNGRIKPAGFWEAYGGIGALVKSPFLWFAFVFSVVFFPVGLGNKWVDYSQNIFPDLLGFTLGGFAIFVSFGNERFVSLLTGPDEDGKPSPLLSISASFAYFIFCQIVALIYSIAFEFFPELFSLIAWFPKRDEFFAVIELSLSFLGAFLTIYALLLAVAATHSIFRLVCLFDMFDSSKDHQR